MPHWHVNPHQPSDWRALLWAVERRCAHDHSRLRCVALNPTPHPHLHHHLPMLMLTPPTLICILYPHPNPHLHPPPSPSTLTLSQAWGSRSPSFSWRGRITSGCSRKRERLTQCLTYLPTCLLAWELACLLTSQGSSCQRLKQCMASHLFACMDACTLDPCAMCGAGTRFICRPCSYSLTYLQVRAACAEPPLAGALCVRHPRPRRRRHLHSGTRLGRCSGGHRCGGHHLWCRHAVYERGRTALRACLVSRPSKYSQPGSTVLAQSLTSVRAMCRASCLLWTWRRSSLRLTTRSTLRLPNAFATGLSASCAASASRPSPSPSPSPSLPPPPSPPPPPSTSS